VAHSQSWQKLPELRIYARLVGRLGIGRRFVYSPGRVSPLAGCFGRKRSVRLCASESDARRLNVPHESEESATGRPSKPPQNCGDLPDDLSVGAILELLRADCAPRIAMNDEIAFIERATAT
jgi:hypothetical protein